MSGSKEARARSGLRKVLCRIAPEIDLDTIDPSAYLREEADLVGEGRAEGAARSFARFPVWRRPRTGTCRPLGVDFLPQSPGRRFSETIPLAWNPSRPAAHAGNVTCKRTRERSAASAITPASGGTPVFRTIAVPLDGSTFAEHAIPPALSMAERSGGEIHLVSVVSPLESFDLDLEDERVLRRWSQGARERVQEYLEEIHGRIRDTGTQVPIRTRTLPGHPVQALHKWILEESVDQVVMTTHGLGGAKRLWLGSVADGLVRRVPAPVLLWRPRGEDLDLTERPTLQRILVPLDGSELAEAMLFWAKELARLFTVPISLVGIVPMSRPFGVEAPGEEELAASEEELAAYLSGVARRTKEERISVDTAVLRGPFVANEILSHQKRVGADVVALSTHGRGGLTRLLLGSVADKVIRGSEGHVLVHRDTEEQ